MIKTTYDKSVDAIYIYLKEIVPGETSFTYSCDPFKIKGEINLDFDKKNRLIGIEILDASKKLPKTIIDNAIKINK